MHNIKGMLGSVIDTALKRCLNMFAKLTPVAEPGKKNWDGRYQIN
jgi:hypothetical protein